jgi:transcriptional regulator with XRE-family HTH domain
MSQETLAEHICLTFQQVQNYEQGKHRVTASGLVQIAEVLGTSIEPFVDLSQPQTDPAAPNDPDARQLLRH